MSFWGFANNPAKLPGAVDAGITINVNEGTLTLTGESPTVTLILVRNIGEGALTLTGESPAVALALVRNITEGVLTLTGEGITVEISTDISISVNEGTLTLTGESPTVTLSLVRNISEGTLTLTGESPTVTSGLNTITEAVNYDGTARLSRTTALVGAPSAADEGTVSAWVKPQFDAGGTIIRLADEQGSTTEVISIVISTSVTFTVTAASSNSIVSQTIATDIRDNQWHRIAMAWDRVGGNGKVWVDDSETTFTPGNFALDWTAMDGNSIGSAATGSQSSAYGGCMAQLWAHPTYLANATEFKILNGPTDIGLDGSGTSFGSKPLIFFDGDETEIQPNRGSGGTFTLTSTLTNCIRPRQGFDITEGTLTLTGEGITVTLNLVRNITEGQLVLSGVQPDVINTGVVVETRAGGGYRGPYRQRYPRRISIDGTVYWVNSPEEERALLEAFRAKLERQAELAQTPKRKKTLTLRVRRVTKRIEKVDNQEEIWLERLRQEDEEILTLLQ